MLQKMCVRVRNLGLAALGASLLALSGCASTSADQAQAQAAAQARYSTWATPIGVLIEDPAARAVIDSHMPQFSEGPMLGMARGMTFRAIQGYAPALFTEETFSAIDADLARLTPIPTPEWAANIRTPNFDEDNVPPYELPDPLTLANGQPVRDAETWWEQRRPEILELFQSEVYGRSPGRPDGQRFEVFDTGTPALDGRAIRKQVIIHLADDPEAPTIQLVEYIPANATGPVPMFLMLSFGMPADDPGARPFAPVRMGMTMPAGAGDDTREAMAESGGLSPMPIEQFLDAGFGVAAINYTDVDPDFEGGYDQGIRGYLDGGEASDRAPDAWGALAAWAWSLSRVQDYFETDPAVDTERVAIFGASRNGKAALWAGAVDQRFAAVVACCSGEVGASLLRRNFGKTFAVATAADATFWTAPNFAQYYGHPERLPVDAHMLLALIAPRPVLLQTGDLDLAGDPHGEFLAAIAASPVYELLGAEGLGADADAWQPEAPILTDLGYFVHEGGHGMIAEDWDVYLAFLRRHLQP